ncbi:MAG: MBL fold metallo-hydrolase [Terriglobia bacterium]
MKRIFNNLKSQMLPETDKTRRRSTRRTGAAPRLRLMDALRWSPAISLLVACVFMLFFSSRPAYALGRNYAVRQVAPNTFVWVPDDVMDQNGDPYFSRAGNVGFVITSEGVVVVNAANNPFHAGEILYEIRQRTQLPVRLVIDLGPQGDEMLGNEVFAEQRATIISTSAAESEMQVYQRDIERRLTFDPELPARMRGIHFTLPGQTFQNQSVLNLGGTEIRMTSMNCGLPGETDGDAVVYLPQQKVLFLGDLYVKGFVPQVGSRDVGRWISVLGQVGKWDVTTYVPGHGDPGTKSDLANFRGFLEWLDAGVTAGVQQGKSFSDVEQRLLTSSAFNLLALDLAPKTIAAVYNQIVHARSAHLNAGRPAGPANQHLVLPGSPSPGSVRGFANPPTSHE